MTKPSNIAGIEEATRRGWKEWVESLDRAGARELTHRQIANIVNKELVNSVENAGWWAQSVTVAYEQHIGRRVPGQRNDGSYEVSVTKLIPGPKEDVYALWIDAYGGATEFDGKQIEEVRRSSTAIREYWRCNFVNGSRLTVAVEQRTSEKAVIAVAHTKLSSEKEKDSWQRFWRETLDKL